ncbi:formate dehydrogenase [Cupriavidus sp. SK-4]|uniref:formate dehydrogenase n=1 Tax=Cupriavidus sp. SK-4 TaxID=574750 RepID=UPI0004522360|nr:formate dehydrogenase [Cupriavidus sp. SK-4]EYS96896.1 formate dehydrogenase [Cupriavidus sp. SK-4]
MTEKQTRVARRTFLAGAGVVAAATGAAALAALTARGPAMPGQATALPEPTDPPSDSKGYRVSDHIRKYYRTTLV